MLSTEEVTATSVTLNEEFTTDNKKVIEGQ